MVRRIALVVLLLFSFTILADARMNAVRLCPAKQSSVSAFCTGGTCTGANVLCESLESSSLCATSYESVCFSSWTASKSGSSTVNFDQTASGTIGCADGGTYHIELTNVASAYSNVEASFSDQTDTSVTVMWYFGATNLADATAVELMRIYNSSNLVRGVRLELYRSGSNYKIQGYFFNSSFGQTSFGPSTGTVSTGNWYPIRIKYRNVATKQVKVEVDFNNDGTFDETLVDSSDTYPSTTSDQNRILLGTYYATSTTFTYGFDNIAVDSTGTAKSCTR